MVIDTLMLIGFLGESVRIIYNKLLGEYVRELV